MGLRRGTKNWRRLFFWMVNQAILNEFALYQSKTRSASMATRNQLDFRLALFDQIAEHYYWHGKQPSIWSRRSTPLLYL
jgi:hypothetical protein